MDIKKFWEKRVIDFGELSTGYTDPIFYEYDDNIRWSTFVNNVKIKKGNRVLDVGCNFGKWCRKIKALGAEVIGIDISEKVINIAKSYKNNITYHAVKAEDMNFHKNSFDVIISITVLQHILDNKKFEKAVKKISDSVKKEGLVFIIDSAPVDKKKSKIIYKTERKLKPYIEIFKKNNLKMEKIYGIDFLGYKIYWTLDYILGKNFPNWLKKSVFLISNPFDKLFSRIQYLYRFSNTKVMIFKKV